MKSIINWAGSREKDLDVILPMLPSDINKFVDPFLGGGEVYLNVPAKSFSVGDRSEPLMEIWRMAAAQMPGFLELLAKFCHGWTSVDRVCGNVMDMLWQVYDNYDKGIIKSYQSLVASVSRVLRECSCGEILPECWSNKKDLWTELRHQLVVTMEQVKKNPRIQKETSVKKCLRTATKEAFYEYLLYLFNQPGQRPQMRCAITLFVMNYAKGGRYEVDGYDIFCPDYGGKSVDDLSIGDRLDVIRSKEFREHVERTQFFKKEFLPMLNYEAPTEKDFIFADTPCTRYNKYFTQQSQEQLAEYLLRQTSARWMAIMNLKEPIIDVYQEHDLKFLPMGEELIIWNY